MSHFVKKATNNFENSSLGQPVINYQNNFSVLFSFPPSVSFFLLSLFIPFPFSKIIYVSIYSLQVLCTIRWILWVFFTFLLFKLPFNTKKNFKQNTNPLGMLSLGSSSLGPLWIPSAQCDFPAVLRAQPASEWCSCLVRCGRDQLQAGSPPGSQRLWGALQGNIGGEHSAAWAPRGNPNETEK